MLAKLKFPYLQGETSNLPIKKSVPAGSARVQLCDGLLATVQQGATH
jgi:hypothetical protein